MAKSGRVYKVSFDVTVNAERAVTFYHGLGTRDVIVITRFANPSDEMMPAVWVSMTTLNEVEVMFPSLGEYNVTIVG